jgi:hypothetical protein
VPRVSYASFSTLVRVSSSSQIETLDRQAEYSQCQKSTVEPTPIPLPTAPVRVVAIGDAITHGGKTDGYRAYLKELLGRDKFLVDFIGSKKCGGIMEDNECEAYPGKTIAEITANVDAALTEDPDVRYSPFFFYLTF